MEDIFMLKWINENSTIGEKEVNRKEFLQTMEEIKDKYVGNNVFATKFVEVAPEMDTMKINFRRNQDLEIPFVICSVDGVDEIIPIPRNHKIIWGILFELSM